MPPVDLALNVLGLRILPFNNFNCMYANISYPVPKNRVNQPPFVNASKRLSLTPVSLCVTEFF